MVREVHGWLVSVVIQGTWTWVASYFFFSPLEVGAVRASLAIVDGLRTVICWLIASLAWYELFHPEPEVLEEEAFVLLSGVG